METARFATAVEGLTQEEWSRRYQEWNAQYNRLKAIAERVRKARNRRARAACAAAGLDPSLLGVHPHNAMCGYRAGKPWPGIDYGKVRLCLWLLERQWDADRIVSAWDARVRGYPAPEYVQETMRKLADRRARRERRHARPNTLAY